MNMNIKELWLPIRVAVIQAEAGIGGHAVIGKVIIRAAVIWNLAL